MAVEKQCCTSRSDSATERRRLDISLVRLEYASSVHAAMKDQHATKLADSGHLIKRIVNPNQESGRTNCIKLRAATLQARVDETKLPVRDSSTTPITKRSVALTRLQCTR